MLKQRHERYLIKYCMISRAVLTFLSCISQNVLPNHDPKVFISPVSLYSVPKSQYDKIILFLLGGLTHWDAQHFYQISQNNYIYEQSLAFFPFYPFMLSLLSFVSKLLFGDYLNVYSRLILVSYLLNFTCFTISSIILFRLSKIILKNDLMAFKSTLLFYISPSTIFFLASYSESLFSLLVFSGMLKYTKGQLFKCSLFFALATACRSNGILNIGYILHYFFYSMFIKKLFSLNNFINIVKCILYTLIVISPYLLFQLFTYHLYCVNPSFIDIPKKLIDYGQDQNFKILSQNISWCDQSLPLSYSYVQSYYWDVGFLKYYTMKQIPNFLLAVPVTLIIIPYSFYFFKYYRYLFINLRLIYNPNLKYFVKSPSYINYLLPRSTFVFNVHAFVLIIFCLLNINVQVTTRILCSSNPLIYWISAIYFKKPLMTVKLSKNMFNFSLLGLEPRCKIGFYLRIYYLFFSLIGVVLFSCNFPWT